MTAGRRPRLLVAFAPRCTTGPIFAQTYGYAGGAIELIRSGADPVSCFAAHR